MDLPPTARPHAQADDTAERRSLAGLRGSAIAVTGLALAFATAFEVSTHLRSVVAFNLAAVDPYYSVGSFAMQVALFLGVASLVRAWASTPDRLTDPRICSMVRMQFCVVAAVAVALVAAAVAFARNGTAWQATRAQVAFAGSFAALATVAAIAGWLSLRAGRGCVRPPATGQVLRALGTLVAAAAVLAIYPEGFRHSVFGAAATSVVGAALLFAPMAETSLAFVPHSTNLFAEALDLPESLRSEVTQWVIVVSTGVGAAAFLAIAEALAQGGGSLQVAAIALRIGVEIAAVAIGFGMLRGPLGLRHP